jgi:REP element-mobilizing transposase RayT
MKSNSPQKHHRRSIRLQGFDYSSQGAYFVTIVTQGREHLFGDIVDEAMTLNQAGEMVVKWWNELPNKFPNVILGECVVMPNHFHGIIFIVRTVGADLRVCPDDAGNASAQKGGISKKGEHIGSPIRTAPLSRIVQWFKTMTTNEYIRGVKHLNWKPFVGKLWQRNYFEHVIRNETDLHQKTDYIVGNPSRWDEDDENPMKSK